MAGRGFVVRRWRSDDRPGVDALLEPGADPLWAVQGHGLHGADRDWPRWRRTLVAADRGTILGAATVAVNRVHPGRLSCAVEVAAAHRRRGVGLALLTAARGIRPVRLPLAGKVRPASAGHRFVAVAGGRPYQRCLGPRVDPRDPAVRRWCAGAEPVAGAEPRSLAGFAPRELAAAFAEQYLWVHEGWSPVGSLDALAEVAATTVAEADTATSAAAIIGGRLAAVAWSFPGTDGVVELVAETQSRHEPDGVRVLASVLARCLTALGDAGFHTAEFDGHVSDPHLAPVVDSMPLAGVDPLLLVELR